MAKCSIYDWKETKEYYLTMLRELARDYPLGVREAADQLLGELVWIYDCKTLEEWLDKNRKDLRWLWYAWMD